MANEIKLKITATDDASDEIKDVNKELENLGDVAETTGEKIHDVGEEIKDSVSQVSFQEQLGALSAFKDAALDAFSKVGRAIGGMVDEYNDYVEQVENLSRLTGSSLEDTSRMIQVADDMRISYEQMSTAMEAATRQGIDVSAEGIIKLAATYQSLAPGVERSEWLLKTFGQSGAEMGRLLEQPTQNIRDMYASIADGMIINQANYDQMVQSKLAYDNFNDSITATKYQIVAELIPAFTALPQPVKDAGMAIVAFGPGIVDTIGTIADLTIAIGGLSKLFAAGGILSKIPTMLTSIKVAAAGLGLAVAPVLALAAAIGGLIALLNSDFGKKGVEAGRQLFVMWSNLIYGNKGGQWANSVSSGVQMWATGKASGGSVSGGSPYVVGEAGPELFIPSGSGTIIPNNQMATAAGGGGSVIFNYQPTVSFASRAEAEMVLKPMIESIVRSRYGKS